MVLSPLILRLIIDDGILRHREGVVVALSLAIAGLALVDAGATYAKSWYSEWIGRAWCWNCGASLFRHVLRQPLAFFTPDPNPGRWFPGWEHASTRRSGWSGW